MNSKTLFFFKLFLIIFIIINISLAETDWRKYGWQIFENAGEGRSLSMGNAGVADFQLNSTLWNPAIVAIANSTHLSYGHQSRFAGIIQSDFLSFPFSVKSNRSFHMIVLHESVGKIPKTSDLLLDWGADGVPNTGDQGENNGLIDEGERLDSDNVSYFNQQQFGFQLSTTLRVYDFDLGISIRGLIHTLGKNWGSGIGFDVGFIRSFWKNSYFGLMFRNLIPAMVVWDSGYVELTKPKLLSGLSQTIDIPKFDIKILLLGDIMLNITNETLNDDFSVGSNGGNFRIGSELTYKNKINIRVGRNPYGYISTGIGLKWTNLQLNYAYLLNSNSEDLGSTHVLSFDINPDWLKSIFERNIIIK